MSHSWYKKTNDILILSIYVQPNAKQNEVMGLYECALKIKLASPPLDGRANAALIKYLATLFDVSQSNVTIKRGQSSRHKIVEIKHSHTDPLSIWQ